MKNRFKSLSPKRQAYILNIPDFPGAYWWAQRPRALCKDRTASTQTVPGAYGNGESGTRHWFGTKEHSQEDLRALILAITGRGDHMKLVTMTQGPKAMQGPRSVLLLRGLQDNGGQGPLSPVTTSLQDLAVQLESCLGCNRDSISYLAKVFPVQ